jgi:hypothetical protein
MSNAMHRKCLAAAIGAVLAGALALTGCATRATTASTTTPTAHAATAASADGGARIMIYSINSDGPELRAIVTGAIGDYGPAVTVLPDGKVDPSHSNYLKLTLSRGSFQLSITDLDNKFVSATSHEPVYPRTCTDFVSVTAAVPVVAGSGTGAYQSISGSFTVTATLNEIEAKPCEPDNAFVWQAIVFAGPGTISLR